ncbi:hypothetical protein [Streptomyces halstedii]|uniref:hypothetical protein n=1 Tax=Streptomyces halstedii TaxID=1944 RepID=UPI003803916B
MRERPLLLGTEIIKQARAAGHRTVATCHTTTPAITSDTAWYPLDLRDPDRMAEVRPCLIINASSGGVDWATTAQAPVRCPVHVSDLAAALLELAEYDAAGVHHAAGTDAVSRHELGVLIARRDGLDAARLAAGLRAESTLSGPLDVRLDSRTTQHLLSTWPRGAHEFLVAHEDGPRG